MCKLEVHLAPDHHTLVAPLPWLVKLGNYFCGWLYLNRESHQGSPFSNKFAFPQDRSLSWFSLPSGCLYHHTSEDCGIFASRKLLSNNYNGLSTFAFSASLNVLIFLSFLKCVVFAISPLSSSWAQNIEEQPFYSLAQHIVWTISVIKQSNNLLNNVFLNSVPILFT